MLIEFSVSNFRSFREKQTLSMVAAPRLHKRENVFKPEPKSEKFPDLLKVAVIYGPNASGKSNLLKALEVVRLIARQTPSADSGTLLPVTPFLFDATLSNQPSEFELHFIQAGLRYQFNLAATNKRIVSEKLLVFPKGKETLLYSRQNSDAGELYNFGDLLTQSQVSTILESWKKLTPPKLLFIAQAIANSSETDNPLKDPFEWIKESGEFLLTSMNDAMNFPHKFIQGGGFGEHIAQFLREVDVPISNVRFEQTETPKVDSYIHDIKTFFTHKTALGEAELSYENQSEGTKNLFLFWLPWQFKERLPWTKLLIVDELDSSLHPEIVARLVEKHINSAKPSQLIFSTHDTHLMDAKILRRDQFWITERDMNGATQLRSIYDFEGRESEDIEKRYYEGRYRGLPLIKRG